MVWVLVYLFLKMKLPWWMIFIYVRTWSGYLNRTIGEENLWPYQIPQLNLFCRLYLVLGPFHPKGKSLLLLFSLRLSYLCPQGVQLFVHPREWVGWYPMWPSFLGGLSSGIWAHTLKLTLPDKITKESGEVMMTQHSEDFLWERKHFQSTTSLVRNPSQSSFPPKANRIGNWSPRE